MALGCLTYMTGCVDESMLHHELDWSLTDQVHSATHSRQQASRDSLSEHSHGPLCQDAQRAKAADTVKYATCQGSANPSGHTDDTLSSSELKSLHCSGALVQPVLLKSPHQQRST